MKINTETITKKYIQQNGGISIIENALLLFYSNPKNRYKDGISISEELNIPLDEFLTAHNSLLKKKLIE